MQLPALLTALALVGSVGYGMAQPVPAPAFHIYHFESAINGTAFDEVFLVHTVSPTLHAAIADIQLYQNGAIQPVTWLDGDGWLSEGDRFWFTQEAFDVKTTLTAQWQGQIVMTCLFGGGAGVPITPDEWRGMGLGSEVRCLQDSHDQ